MDTSCVCVSLAHRFVLNGSDHDSDFRVGLLCARNCVSVRRDRSRRELARESDMQERKEERERSRPRQPEEGAEKSVDVTVPQNLEELEAAAQIMHRSAHSIAR